MRGSGLCLGLLAALAACATPSREELASGDPLEGVNRSVYGFNETVNRAVAEHVVLPARDAVNENSSDGAKKGTGEALTRARRVFTNLGEPKNAVNGALQGDAGAVATATARFGLNSTVGLLGMYDVAGGIGIEEQREDFGQTLGSWGADPGPYVVAPLAGPTNARDLTGSVVDTVLNPASLFVPGGAAVTVARTGVRAAGSVDDAEAVMNRPEDIDHYAAERARYGLSREQAIANMDADPPLRGQQIGAPIEHRIATPSGRPDAAPAVAGAVPLRALDTVEGGAPAVVNAAAPAAQTPAEAPARPRRESEDGPRGLVIDIYPVNADDDDAPADLRPDPGG